MLATHGVVPAPLTMLQTCCSILVSDLVLSRTEHALLRQSAVAVRDALSAALSVVLWLLKQHLRY